MKSLMLAVGIAALMSTPSLALISEAPWFYGADGWPLVVGHRGSLGHFPEHTIAGYTDAWLMGADYVELDLQMTRDGFLIANHDQCLKDSTDAVLFDSLWSKRQKTYTFSNGNVCENDYMIPEFTLSELKQVKRKQRFDYRSTSLDGLF